MNVQLGIPGERLEDVTRLLWQKLNAKAVPFPFDYSDEDLTVRSEGIGCDEEMSPWAGAMATLFEVEAIPLLGIESTKTARFCFSEEFFQYTCDVQLGVMLHEAVHIRLYLGRLRNNWLAAKAFDETSRKRASTGDRDVYRFATASNDVAKALLNLVAEIGVDTFMKSQCDWISADHWRTRCQNLYLDGTRWLVDSLRDRYPHEMPISLQPYIAFCRLVALDLGLQIVTSDDDQKALRSRRDTYVADLGTVCDEATAGWLESWRTKMLTFDPIPTEPDPEAYDAVCNRVLALTA